MDTQLKKGLLEICVLAVLKKEDSYGYKIVKDISPYIEISESTCIPYSGGWKTANASVFIPWSITDV
mgnify:CR=1 FL=1